MWLRPIDEVDGLCHLPGLELHRHAVAQQTVYGLVIAVERAGVIVSLGAELVEGNPNLLSCVAALGQPGRKQTLLDVAVVFAVGPIPQVAIGELLAEQGNESVLRRTLECSDSDHLMPVMRVGSSR